MKQRGSTGVFVSVRGSVFLKMGGCVLLFLLAVFFLSGLLTSLKPELRPISASVNQASNVVDSKLLYQLMGWENHHFLEIHEDLGASPKLTYIAFKLSSNINLNDPRSLLGRELPGFFQFDGRIAVAGEGTNYTNMPIESPPPAEIMEAEREAALQNLEGLDQSKEKKTVPAPKQTTGGRNVVYLYFSHNRESYLPYLKGVTDPNLAYHSKINVTKIGDELKARLAENGIGSIVDKTDVMGLLTKQGLKMASAYMQSRKGVEAAMSSNRDLAYFIDIHRDARRKDQTTAMIGGQPYAKLAFIIGGKNPNYEKNLRLATTLHNMLKKKYGDGLSRGVIIKQEAGANGIYNQNLSENSILIEFGGVDNTFAELDRSAAALADVFSEYYWQAEKVDQSIAQPAKKQ